MYTRPVLTYYLNLVGVFAFAYGGATVAIKAKLNWLGVLVCAFLPAVGGGTIREVMLNHMPAYFFDNTYVVVIGAGAFCSWLAHQYALMHLRRAMVAADIIGVVMFSYMGATAAYQAHLGLFAAVFFALLTACGGGVVCDFVARIPTRIVHDGLRAIPSVVIGAVCWMGNGTFSTPALTALVFLTGGVLQAGIALGYGHSCKVAVRRLARRLGANSSLMKSSLTEPE